VSEYVKKEFIIGDAGEQIVTEFYNSKGIVVYSPATKTIAHNFDLVVTGANNEIGYVAEVKTKNKVWKRNGKCWIALDKSEWIKMAERYARGKDTLLWIVQGTDSGKHYLYAQWFSKMLVAETKEETVQQKEEQRYSHKKVDKPKELVLTEASAFKVVRRIKEDCTLEKISSPQQTLPSTSSLFTNYSSDANRMDYCNSISQYLNDSISS
jgi:Holliday junction resolvase-like predicted endonuclease